MKERILIAGGDMRQLYCANRLSVLYDTAVTGFDGNIFPNDINIRTASPDEQEYYDYVILPVPPLDSEGFINAPFSNEKIPPSAIRKMMKKDCVIMAGKTDDSRLKENFSGSEIIDYMRREELCLLNAIPTAEGGVQIALEEMPVTISGQKVLIVGCGRIGTALAEILKGFGADVTFAVRNPVGAAKSRILGADVCSTTEIPVDFGLVFNTAPSMIFSREVLEKFSRRTLFIDLASKPGGIDFDAAAELGIKVMWAIGLPGKTAPITSGEIIAETVSGIIAERSGTDG
jgi:dipicolinate synthase subunit A